MNSRTPGSWPLCNDCGERRPKGFVQCPVDNEDLRVPLCEECSNERGPGIEVCHVRYDSDWEVNGGRISANVPGSEKRHLDNTSFPAPGWLGNPHQMENESGAERWRVLRAYRQDLLNKLREDSLFAFHLGELRGCRVACWCRSSLETWPGDRDPCHLDIVHAALMGVYADR
ncbi:DUF4326 domain-containing protein [Halococcus sp. IIIV-5B]|uniref:DUF4326 domain-containing protein n=1 Tax=Halococcus sp. IIIV-5B TaxID=2321230 RepID=UPI000E70DD03|nr:DUF4326 domain-containing protein [Halococcus sp. IIIV-5B]